MARTLPVDPLRIGLLGSGFIANFHLQALLGVRHVQVAGVYSPTPARRDALVAKANAMGLGPCRAFDSVEALAASDEIDAIWILGPNFTRLEQMRAIHRAVAQRSTPLLGVACEKPLARTLAEGREMLRLAEDAGLNHGYLENQVFSTAIQRGKDIIWRRGVPATGRPYLARAAEEHSGPHAPWFWRGDLQGGGVLLDMMCHSVEVARYLLTDPSKDRTSLRVRSANGTVANLKWAQPKFAKRLQERMGADIDYTRRPAEDFARGVVTLEDEAGNPLIIETTTSWSYVGPGLRIQVELLGPEYALEFSSLNTPLKIFLSREVTGAQGEDLVEKQNSEQGLMPVVEDEPGIYGYTLEDRHMVECFRTGQRPIETFHDGVAVLEILMALYRSAELGRTVELPDPALEDYVPPVARVG
ncbi:MAG: Gfo/Idh/MocA family oxidoreductase [Sphaerobacter sp.]|nr:Gfo/Idh/MocA family oxidoreductase [Sphaerobacter sp.]